MRPRSGAPKKRSLRDSVAGLFGGDPPLPAPASAVAANASRMVPGAHASVLPEGNGGGDNVAPAQVDASRALRKGLQEIFKSAQDARYFNSHDGAPTKAARAERHPDEGSASAAALSAVPSRMAVPSPAVGSKVRTLCPLRMSASDDAKGGRTACLRRGRCCHLSPLPSAIRQG